MTHYLFWHPEADLFMAGGMKTYGRFFLKENIPKVYWETQESIPPLQTCYDSSVHGNPPSGSLVLGNTTPWLQKQAQLRLQNYDHGLEDK